MPRWHRAAGQLDVLVLIIVAGFLGWTLAGGATLRNQAPGKKWLETAYGADKNSRALEELIIRDFFNDRRGGFFLDVGSGRFQTGSNTYFLEKSLGWRGIAIDANPNLPPTSTHTGQPRNSFRSSCPTFLTPSSTSMS
jgi:hypothetical protein